MEIVLLDDVIDTDYGQFDIVWDEDAGFDGDPDRFFAGQVNGLVGAADPGGVYLNLARRSGGSGMRIVLLGEVPGPPASWFEDVVEVSIVVPEDADPRWTAWGGMSGGTLPGLAPGSYRVRVSGQGRDAGADGEFADGVVDEYLVEIWQSERRPDEILRADSENGQYWHREWGGRR